MKTLQKALLAIVLFSNSGLNAALIASADFESNSPSTLHNQGGGTGFSGNWSVSGDTSRVTVISSALSYSNGAVSSSGGGKALQFKFDAAESGAVSDGIMQRALSSTQTGTVYMSLLFRETSNDEAFTLGGPNDFVQWGFDNGTDGNPNASIMRRNGELQARSSQATSGSTGSGTLTTLNTTRMLVFKATRGGGDYNNISLFIDPGSLSETTADATSTTNSGINSFSHFIARSAFHELNDSFQIDNILIGDSWADVVVPEPSALLLTAFGSLLFLRRSR